MSTVSAFRGAAILLVLGAPLRNPGAAGGAPRPLDVSLEAASFPAPGGGAETHLYLSIPLGTLSGDSASFHATLDVEPGPASDSWGDTRVFPAVPLGGGGTVRGIFRHVYVVPLPPGRGKARVRVEELESERVGEATVGFEVRDYRNGGISLSDVVIGTRVGSERGPDPVFPLPGGEFGGDRDTLVAFFRIRDDRTEDAASYRVEAAFRGRRGPRPVERLSVPRLDGSGEAILERSLAGFPPGEYRVRVAVTLGEASADADGWFQVGESGQSLGEDPDRLRTVLGYVATQRERIQLEDAPDDSLPAIWNRFWVIRDPTPGTPRNESEEEFLNRVQEADRRYGGLDPGWKTDMGRIYIRYGPPDRVERFEGGPTRSPTEVWTYSARGTRFVFEDVGFGRYRLALGR